MRAALVIFGLIVWSPATAANDGLARGGELGELRYACFGDDAEAFTGSRAASNEACAVWDDMVLKAKNAGLCYDADTFDWLPCT